MGLPRDPDIIITCSKSSKVVVYEGWGGVKALRCLPVCLLSGHTKGLKKDSAGVGILTLVVSVSPSKATALSAPSRKHCEVEPDLKSLHFRMTSNSLLCHQNHRLHLPLFVSFIKISSQGK